MTELDPLGLDPIVLALEDCARLPLPAVETLFARYGRPLEAEDVQLAPSRLLSDGQTTVGRLSYRAPVDVIANDHFVLVRPGEAARAMPGPLFAAAIAALTRRHAG